MKFILRRLKCRAIRQSSGSVLRFSTRGSSNHNNLLHRSHRAVIDFRAIRSFLRWVSHRTAKSWRKNQRRAWEGSYMGLALLAVIWLITFVSTYFFIAKTWWLPTG